ncbi:hypothetical protein GM415_08310 [Pseudodesulfovibrio cashew]|uniref:Uncharacterized protein n=1 Tax=Pseudodesulfovibrio cashew TaxID=2678688 RepID=A0A6I6JGI4_9BACT|nr:hypothetical protein [Pseudodesulfovibrio cashew]QGY40128.1 hypothetical protein GM415_08310 [Pseudodesulfovibrio cashew]
MIDKAGAIPLILTRLKKLPVGAGLDLRTYKRDRSVIIMKEDVETYAVIEDGFRQERFKSGHKELKRLLRTLLKREFPRSHKIRVHEFPG